MTRGLAIIILLAAALSPCHAEVFIGARKGIGLGFHYMGGDGGSASFVPGFTGGIVAGTPFNERVGARAELLISGKGGRDEQQALDIRISALELPILFRAQFPVGTRWLTLALMTGPVVSYRLGGSARGEETTSTIEESDLRRLDIGAALAVEIGARVRAYTVSLEARMDVGFLPIFDLSGSSARDALLSLGLGYGVHLPTTADRGIPRR